MFNQKLSSNEPEKTTVGYMPIILAPATQLDTINTVIKRCMTVAAKLGQEHTVITADEAVYSKIMELKWSVPEYRDKLIVRLGGLHTAMIFMCVIGKHMRSSGLREAWVESGLLGPGVTERVLIGKNYKKGMRVHKLTFQVLWYMILPRLLQFCQRVNQQLFDEISNNVADRRHPFKRSLPFFKEIRGASNLDRVCWKGS